MKIAQVIHLCFLFVSPFANSAADFLDSPPRFISLGSHCEVAWYLGYHDLRHAAFPFDWLLTFDHQRFIDLIENDFEFFIDLRYLSVHSAGNVINTYYNIDFRHDWSVDFEGDTPEVLAKYQRRIQRFSDLDKYQGKVYFFRGAFDLSLDPALPTITKECSQITHDQAEALKNLLFENFLV